MLKPPTNSISANDSTSSWTTEKPKMIGVMGTPRRAEIGYKLHPNYWGKGYMSEALTLFLKMFWESEGLFLDLVISDFVRPLCVENVLIKSNSKQKLHPLRSRRRPHQYCKYKSTGESRLSKGRVQEGFLATRSQ